MQIKVQGLNVNYIQYGKGKDILLLHGWGQNIEMMKPLGDNFSDRFRITILDLPGFGKSEEPKTVWSLEDYVEMIHSLLDSLGIKKVSLIGHSFGGKLSIIYASKYDVDRVVLLASPYKVSKQELSTKQKILKGMKKIPGLNLLADSMKKFVGSTDYKNASPMMRKILVNHINTDAVENCKKIKCFL